MKFPLSFKDVPSEDMPHEWKPKDELKTRLFDRVQDDHWDTLADEREAKVLNVPASPELKILSPRENIGTGSVGRPDIRFLSAVMKGFCVSEEKVREQAGAREQVVDKEALRFVDSDPETHGVNEYQEMFDVEPQVPC